LVYARVRDLTGELESLRELAGARERELDLLEFELSEIEAAALSEAEDAELRAERERLRHLEGLRGAALAGAEAPAPEAAAAGAAMSWPAPRWRWRASPPAWPRRRPSSTGWRKSSATSGVRPRHGWPRRCASGSESWPWRGRASRSRWRRATPAARPATRR